MASKAKRHSRFCSYCYDNGCGLADAVADIQAYAEGADEPPAWAGEAEREAHAVRAIGLLFEAKGIPSGEEYRNAWAAVFGPVEEEV